MPWSYFTPEEKKKSLKRNEASRLLAKPVESVRAVWDS